MQAAQGGAGRVLIGNQPGCEVREEEEESIRNAGLELFEGGRAILFY